MEETYFFECLLLSSSSRLSTLEVQKCQTFSMKTIPDNNLSFAVAFNGFEKFMKQSGWDALDSFG